jgi:hypothetical protein
MIRKGQAPRQLLAFGVLNSIQTPVTIRSPTEDTINDPVRHAFAAYHLPRCKLHKSEASIDTLGSPSMNSNSASACRA